MRAIVRGLGFLGYQEAWEIQKQVAEEVISGAPDTLLLVEHPPVLTLGASFHSENLLFTREQIEARGVQVHETDRGGDVTYHGPGQLVMYPIFDVSRHGKDLHQWLRDLEETQIQLLAGLGIEARRFAPHTGAWVGEEKVAAIGVKIRKWVSLHGIALNCSNDLKEFGLIVPCGISNYGVTSVSQLLGRVFSVEEAKPLATRAFESVFGLNFE
ncbi:MAG: lipoyl(octanoyl) transferase LipB [Fimbriimonadaceae bacterium]|nr:lipoyl(octanoyl) transferase LipB [Fimbriimonadaceae bacterium]